MSSLLERSNAPTSHHNFTGRSFLPVLDLARAVAPAYKNDLLSQSYSRHDHTPPLKCISPERLLRIAISVSFLDAGPAQCEGWLSLDRLYTNELHTLCQKAESTQPRDIYEIEPLRFGGKEKLPEHIIQLVEGYDVKAGRKRYCMLQWFPSGNREQ